MEDFEQKIELEDVYSDEPETIKGTIEAGPDGVLFNFEGFFDYHGAHSILIENQNGIPHVVIWGDNTREEPTHIISLEGAKVDKAS